MIEKIKYFQNIKKQKIFIMISIFLKLQKQEIKLISIRNSYKHKKN
jgi:hypothetical protein